MNVLKLINRGDGVDGHYCIGRSTDGKYYEFWHDKYEWCSAGTVYIGISSAESKLSSLLIDDKNQIVVINDANEVSICN